MRFQRIVTKFIDPGIRIRSKDVSDAEASRSIAVIVKRVTLSTFDAIKPINFRRIESSRETGIRGVEDTLKIRYKPLRSAGGW